MRDSESEAINRAITTIRNARIWFLSLRGRLALRYSEPTTLLRIEKAILAELNEKESKKTRRLYATAVAYFGDSPAAISYDKIGAAFGLYFRWALQEAIKLLEPHKSDLDCLVQFEGFREIEEGCQIKPRRRSQAAQRRLSIVLTGQS